MPLYEDRIELIKNNLGEPLAACIHCHKAADDHAETIGALPFLLMCPDAQLTLGEWATKAERVSAITDFLQQHRI
jgi:hypothetical protein